MCMWPLATPGLCLINFTLSTCAHCLSACTHVFLYALIYLSDAYHTPVNLCHSIKLLYFLLLGRDITAEPATAVLGFTLRKLVRRYT